MVKDAWDGGFATTDDDDMPDDGRTSTLLNLWGGSRAAAADPYRGEDGQVPRGQPGQPKQPKCDEEGLPLQIRFTKKKLLPGAAMGKVRRSPMTGHIVMAAPKTSAYPNFQVVDLAGRASLPLDREDLEEDPYLFKPTPLMYRTWIYQFIFDSESAFASSNDEDFVVKQALNHFVLDHPMMDGRWSPMMAYAFIMFISALTCHPWTIIIGCLVGLFCTSVSVSCNTPDVYRMERNITLPFRIGYLIFVLLVFPSEGFLQVVGSVGTILLIVMEILCGDFRIVDTYRFHCSYEVHSSLGKRVFVCTRFGASTLEEEFQIPNASVDEKVTNVANWGPEFHLLAELEGLLVELRPMTKTDWKSAAKEYNWYLKPLTFIGIPLREYEGKDKVYSLAEDDGFVPTKKGRQAQRGTVNLGTLATFRDAREVFDNVEHLDWMIEEVENS
mmetsp:Transcript_12007/g.21285  ORF Transcript_12007/g.21285 Transcript_12007/m.21285 type:complete len:442 (-) Transcript_12007:141-1466(-)|eukprot:CAMPEP_0197662270 /NCGR_PEP_ID=MMETSP1338-20131121/52731_1 /TAXON_ID=43686 ORGANISM="Pelagodinium beii, Strain RCC1491" /NCGR_SAMPLE_ID=MMETSP1338 /ASSEMBLY_ACC=CAM_ASM_000754 /LENGTH=441 /DNA_ID=CAMNT_0043240039 /DNA_START=84 /DNA_END=1409 /DNA_ORIENTATION=+